MGVSKLSHARRVMVAVWTRDKWEGGIEEGREEKSDADEGHCIMIREGITDSEWDAPRRWGVC